MSPHRARPVEILLVEDSPADIVLIQELFEESRILASIHVVEDGETAIAYLRRSEGFEDAVRPDLVLLDLNLPKKNGTEVLKVVKGSPGLRRIPVVVLTTSDEEADVLRSYDLHANSYITKPVDFDQFHDVVRSIEDFWFSIVRLPDEDDRP